MADLDDRSTGTTSLRASTLRLSAIKASLAYAAYVDPTLVALSQSAKALKAPAGPRKPVEYLTDDQPGRSPQRSPGRLQNLVGTGCC